MTKVMLVIELQRMNHQRCLYQTFTQKTKKTTEFDLRNGNLPDVRIPELSPGGPFFSVFFVFFQLAAKRMFVDGVPFLVTYALQIHSPTLELLSAVKNIYFC